MKKLIFLFFSVLIFAKDDFASFVNNINQSYQTYKKNLYQEFNEYKETLNKEFANYKKELSVYWKNPELTTKKVFVEYSKDKKVKKKVDFQKNYVEVAVIAKDSKTAKKKIIKALFTLSKETTKTAFNNNPVLVKVDKKFSNIGVKSNIPRKPLISDVISTDKLIKSAQKDKIQTKPSKIKNTKGYILKVPLPKNTYIIKARSYKSDVFEKSKRFKLPPYLIYGVIQTESSFNPMARSYVPAFGLMQIVPQTAGKDTYKMLYGKAKLLTPSYLYNPSNNILIGSGYLYKLYYQYFKGVKNPLTRLFLTIAAYNTGPGNVACAFNSNRKDYKGRTICYRFKGDYRISKALPKINSMTPKDVYYYLLKNLRYDEAKNYLKRVFKRSLTYKKALETNQI